MKILVITSSLPRFRGDIAGRFVFEWAQHLRYLGHDLRVFSWADSSVSPDAAPESADFEVLRVPYAPPGYDTLFYGAGTPENIRQNPWRALLAAPAVAAMSVRVLVEIARERPDIIVGHWLLPAGFLARFLGNLTGIPSLIVGHSGGVHLLEQLSTGLLEKIGIGQALARFCASGAMTVPTKALADKFAGVLGSAGDSTMILPMGFEPARRSLPGQVTPREDARDHWLCMGRLVEIKGVDLAIEAFCRADFARPTTLHIAGDGPERARLEALARGLRGEGENTRVEFHGVVSGAAKAALLQRCGFALFCSKTLDNGRHEGLPISFLEAASHGAIALCAEIPGLSDYVVTPDAQTVYTRDISAWTRAIERLAGSSEQVHRQLSEAQRARVDALAWPVLIAKWDALLRTVAVQR
ncbi:glycosyltransferase [Bradymonas sediminis]|uniref:Glycosyltransferase subfamily 4-like N-terminal domain-containing protein n=1 Tax=Bradymonas sediminis TaxID=1548548 RepID=A0A2Z4FHC9_9DELT|nr:glycosyltransferase [Bradymonas sediminis]AWV88329.1 hypothetical protein DN745_02815 [Bradymonas sediminis]TDP77454.1 glycosyltransferase involved in cell wall biosynthesis [Bradymonas sediminis]